MKNVYTCRLARLISPMGSLQIYCKRFLCFLSDLDSCLDRLLKISNRKPYPRWRTEGCPKGDQGTKCRVKERTREETYCDQQTAGGGWTLVWSYTFTDYKNFGSGSNAVTPRPTWTASGANTRVSTTVPLSETHYEAMDFALWRTIGNQTLIKSNINNWIVCMEGTGSIVRQKAGSLSCKLVKQVSQQCAGVVPTSFVLHTYGPYLSSTSLYYYFDGHTSSNSPTHDPCGTNKGNQLSGVANPHGNIFIR